MIQLLKYNEQSFSLPCVVDVIDYQNHIVVDVIQPDGEVFKKDTIISYNGSELAVFKKISDRPIKTDSNIENRLGIRRIRYFCNKIKPNEFPKP